MLQLKHTPPPQSTTPCLHPVSIHQMAPPVRGSKHPITAYYSVYRPRKDDRLSRSRWLVTYTEKNVNRSSWFSAQILRHLNTTTSICDCDVVKTFGTEFWKFYHKGPFFKKRKKCSQSFHVLRRQAEITSQWLQIPETHYQNSHKRRGLWGTEARSSSEFRVQRHAVDRASLEFLPLIAARPQVTRTLAKIAKPL